MAAIFENRELQRPDDSASRTRQKPSGRPHALLSLAFSVALALAFPSTQAISHNADLQVAVNADVTKAPIAVPVTPTPPRQAGARTPRPMTSNDRQAIFMVLMLRDPNASSQILGLTH